MSPQDSSADARTRTRRALLQLGSMLLLTLLTTTLLGLFSIWSLERAHIDSARSQTAVLEAVNLTRDAQVRSRIQVQEWKNLLLRGTDPASRPALRQSLAAEADAVAQRLDELVRRLEALGLEGPAQLAGEVKATHGALTRRYEAVLQQAPSGAWVPGVLDQAVKGVDRPLNQQIDRLVTLVRAAADQRAEELRQSQSQRYDTLTRALWIAMALALGLMGVLWWRVLRTRDR